MLRDRTLYSTLTERVVDKAEFSPCRRGRVVKNLHVPLRPHNFVIQRTFHAERSASKKQKNKKQKNILKISLHFFVRIGVQREEEERLCGETKFGNDRPTRRRELCVTLILDTNLEL